VPTTVLKDMIAGRSSAGAARTDRIRALAAKATLTWRAAARRIYAHQLVAAAQEIAGGQAQGHGSGTEGVQPGAGLPKSSR